MSKPIQIATAVGLTGDNALLENNSSLWALYVLCDDGRIFQRAQFDDDDPKWLEVDGPWTY